MSSFSADSRSLLHTTNRSARSCGRPSRVSTYPWLGRTTKFREWLGDRVIQALEAHSYTIANRNFEDTVSIDRNDIEDDTYGVYEPIIEQLGWDTKVHPDMLLFQMI